jgi:hypothetical protein
MLAISWLKIRDWNGSQWDAFEELCCQLAHSEPMPPGSRFIRKGTPDSGIECYWVLPKADEWGWQAKFYTDGFSASRWKQCDDSVKKALDGHPKLTKLFFCFPWRFPDPRRPDQVSSFQQWENRRTKWATWANERGMSVEFIAWSEHELLQRLSKTEHRGRFWFWFNSPAMDGEWFRRNVAAAVSLADERYSAYLHFELPLARHFDALARTPSFLADLEALGAKLSKTIKSLGSLDSSNVESGKPIDGIRKSLDEALEKINSFSLDVKLQIDFPGLTKALRATEELVRSALHEIWNKRQERAKAFEKERGRRLDHYEFDNDGFTEYRLRETSSCVREITKFCESQEAELANLPALMLVGDAGLGKTHLLCSVAEKQIAAEEPALLLLGQQFIDAEPWSQITTLLSVSCDRDAFLGALDAAGEAAGCRTLIMIDAINDGPGVRFWLKHLAGMLSHLQSFPHVGIALTIRTAYYESASLSKQRIVSVVHHGLAGKTHEATRHFFKHYGLAEPNFPMLEPEFDSPLFLKLICRALKAAGRSTMSPDLVGVSAIFSFVLDETNERLARKLDYPQSSEIVLRSVNRLAELMADSGGEFVPFEVAKSELENIYPVQEWSKSMLWHLIAEHMIVRSPGFAGRDEEMIRFTYQRFSDHLIVKSILTRTRKGDLAKLLQRDRVFGRRTGGDECYGDMAGWLEALAIQLPESYGLEVDELFPGSWDNEVLRRAFLTSLIWRKVGAFSAATETRIRELFDGNHLWELLDVLICVTARPDHPYNADWLDSILQPLKMADRDAWWSIYIFGKTDEDGNIRRLIEWAWAERNESTFSDGVVRLAAVTLTWFLTTSDRFVRDRATKALVSLLENKISILRGILKHFAGVKEPYLQERLFAVSYGCAMLTRQQGELRGLAQDVYDRVFAGGFPPPSLLLRDYARGIVERAVRLGIEIKHDPALIVPPYKSSWPNAPPSLDILGKRFKAANHDDRYWGLSRIFGSITADDFSRYVIYPSWWSGRRRKGKASQAPEALYKELLKGLPARSVTIIEYYAECLKEIETPPDYERNDPERKLERQRTVKEIEALLPRLLGPARARKFKRDIVPHFKTPKDKRPQKVFSDDLFRRLILRRILQLGLTCKRFNEFDRSVSPKGRDAHKPERIGKKYQWIVYDEFNARISDNFGLAETDAGVMDDDTWEDGTWTYRFRDLDPSFLLRCSPQDKRAVNEQGWWMPYEYDAWTSAATHLEWLQKSDDLPEPMDFLPVSGPNGAQWLVLNGFAKWRRKESVGDFRGKEVDTQEVHYIFRSYIVRKEHLASVLAWGKNQDWINDRLPSAASYSQHFQEHFWSPYFDYSIDEAWIDRVWEINDLPHPVVPTTSEFLSAGHDYDCSVDESFTISMPSRWLTRQMGLRMIGRYGDFVDAQDRVVAFDPSTREAGHSILLVDVGALREFLEREKLALFWTLLGEKNIYPPGMLDMRKWLGRLTILGIYAWDGQNISGSFRTEFLKGHG